MSDVKDWSNTAAGNNAPPPDGWPEGMAPSTVNNSARENMAAVRRLAEDGSWFDWGDTITFVAADAFTVTGDGVAERYVLRRKVRVVGATTGTVYGQIRRVDGDTVYIETIGTLQNEALAVSLGPHPDSIDMEPVGSIKPFAYLNSASVPVGWQRCNGGTLAEVDYPLLFQAIGTEFGGGAGSFILPDLRGRAVVGEEGTTSGRLPGYEQIPDAGGQAAVTLTSDQSGRRGFADTLTGTSSTLVQQPAIYSTQGGAEQAVNTGGTSVNLPGTTSTPINITPADANESHTNVQPSMVMRWFIRAT